MTQNNYRKPLTIALAISILLFLNHIQKSRHKVHLLNKRQSQAFQYVCFRKKRRAPVRRDSSLSRPAASSILETRTDRLEALHWPFKLRATSLFPIAPAASPGMLPPIL